MEGKERRIMKRIKFIIGAAGVFCLSMAMEACTSRRSEPLRGPLELTSSEVKNGEILYMATCQKCHPLGEAGLGPAINSNPAPGFIKRFQVRHGLGVMPSFKENEISEAQLKAISKYMKARRHN